MDREEIEQEFRVAFSVAGVALGPTAGLRNAVSLIAYLREAGLRWNDITELINAARVDCAPFKGSAVKKAGTRLLRANLQAEKTRLVPAASPLGGGVGSGVAPRQDWSQQAGKGGASSKPNQPETLTASVNLARRARAAADELDSIK